MRNKFLYFALISIIIVGCKKFSEASNSESELKVYVTRYINSLIINSNSPSKKWLEDSKAKLDYSDIKQVKFDDRNDAILLAIHDINVNEFTNLDRSTKTQVRKLDGTDNRNATVTKVVFMLDLDGKIANADIIQISSTHYSYEDIETRFAWIASGQDKNFEGTISVNSFSQKLLNKFKISNGRRVSSTVVKGKIPTTSTNGQKVNNCQAWYLCTTYYYSDGTTSYNEVFLGFTGCSMGDNEGFVPPSEQGGSGPEITLDTLCAQSKRLSSDLDFSYNLQDLFSRRFETYENGYGRDNSGQWTLYHGNSTGIPPSIIGNNLSSFYHNHLASGGGNVFSASDIQAMYTDLYNAGKIPDLLNFTLGVVTPPDGKIILLRVENVSTYLGWAASNLTLGSIFNTNFQTPYNNAVTSLNSYDDNMKGLLSLLNGSGLAVYEGAVNSISSDGFVKTELNNNTLQRTKCQN